MDGHNPKNLHGHGKHRTAFNLIDAVTIGAMVGIGVFCRRANPESGRWLGMALSSALLEVSKVAKRTLRM